jgi:hypothetical protein
MATGKHLELFRKLHIGSDVRVRGFQWGKAFNNEIVLNSSFLDAWLLATFIVNGGTLKISWPAH